MSSEEIAIILLAQRLKKRRERRKKGQSVHRRFYMRPLNLNRMQDSEFNRLIRPMRTIDAHYHRKYFRMSRERFDDLLARIETKILHAPTHRCPISPSERLAVTLRLLALGDLLQSAAFSYHMGQSTVSTIFQETCNAIWDELKHQFLPVPSKDDWKQISDDYWHFWNYPLCLGAVDGKHVMIQAPKNSGTMFYNYKHYFSIVLLASVDANYCFTLLSIGAYGKQSDGGVFAASKFGKKLAENKLQIPGPAKLPGSNIISPHVFVADDAFQLTPNMMKPYSGTGLSPEKEIFNYRLSRARRLSENAFGVLQARWRILSRKMICAPESADAAVKACVALHNYLRKTDSSHQNESRYIPKFYTDYGDNDGNIKAGGWREEVRGQPFLSVKSSSNNYGKYASQVRNNFRDYFMTENGAVPWQNKILNAGKNAPIC